MSARFRTTKHQIRGLRRLAELIPKNSIGVEVGSGYGESAQIFMESGNVAELLCVDSWEGDCADREPFFDLVAARWPKRIHKAKAKSLYVAHGFTKVQFAFVYLDACHHYKAICDDIKAWLPRVKSGGILCGHDHRGDVEKAVKELLGGPDQVFEDSSWMKIVRRTLPMMVIPPEALCIYCGRPECDSAAISPDGNQNNYHSACVPSEHKGAE